MYQCKMKPYEGDKPYVFVSYAHKDSEKILPFIDWLAESGYRVWYDDGIAPGSEWPENIAQHLSNCQVVFAMVSNNYMASMNCRREVTFALSKNKPFLGIVLESTDMSAGMEMQLSAQQCIDWKNVYLEEEGVFVDTKLLTMPQILPCREVSEREVEAAIAKEQAAARAAQEKLAALKKAEADRIAAEKALQEEKAAKEAEKQKDERQKAEGGKSKKKGKGLWGAAGVVATLIAVVMLLIPSKVKLTENQTVRKNVTSLTMEDAVIDRTVMKQMNKLSSVEYMTLENCKFEGVTLRDLKRIKSVTSIKLHGCEGIDDYSVLGENTGLRTFEAVDCGVTDGALNVLAGLQLSNLDVSDNGLLQNFGFVPERVTVLRMANTGVTNIDFVKDLPRLTEIQIDGCQAISDFEPLTACTELKSLYARDCGITGFQNEFACLELNDLYVTDNQIADGSCFDNLTRLVNVSLYGNPLENADCIEKSASTLNMVNMSYTNVQEDTVKRLLKDCVNVREVSLSGVVLESLDCVSGMKSLRKIVAEGCGITDIKALADKTELQFIYLGDNQIQDTGALAGLTATNRLDIDLHNNDIAKMTLPGEVYMLFAYGNHSETVADFGDCKIQYCVIDYDDALMSGAISDNLAGSEKVKYKYVLDVPADKKLDLIDRLGAGYVKTTTTEKFEAEYGVSRDMEQINTFAME